MSIIFFNSPVGTPKVQFVNTDLSVDSLKAKGVIPEGSVYVKALNPSSEDGIAKLSHVDKLTFDNMTKPTKVVWDMDLVDMFWKDVYRECRSVLMAELDVLQQRALVKGLTEVVVEIESDKQALRDLPDKVDYSNHTGFTSTCLDNPEELFVDYQAKYQQALS